jgi:hypothetical protein
MKHLKGPEEAMYLFCLSRTRRINGKKLLVLVVKPQALVDQMKV